MANIATNDLKKNDEIYEQKSRLSGTELIDFVYLFATFLFLDPDVKLETFLKLTPYRGLLGTDNSLLDSYLKCFKFLQLYFIRLQI